MGWIEAVISNVGGLIVGFLVKLILGYVQDRRAEAAQRDLGAAQNAVAAAQAAASVEKTYADIGAQPHDRAGAVDRLHTGTF